MGNWAQDAVAKPRRSERTMPPHVLSENLACSLRTPPVSLHHPVSLETYLTHALACRPTGEHTPFLFLYRSRPAQRRSLKRHTLHTHGALYPTIFSET